LEKDCLEIHLHTADDKVKFVSGARENDPITVDYFPPIGNGEGYTSLELLLISFSSCVSTTLLTILRAVLHKQADSLKATATGTVRNDHPRSLSHIRLEMSLESRDAREADVKKAIAMAEGKLCPVWAMLKGNVEVSVSCTVIKAEG
jgi:putative redox protein